jgi:hypothetical protein
LSTIISSPDIAALRRHDIGVVTHFAAFLDVAESVREPVRDYRKKTRAIYLAPDGTCPRDRLESVGVRDWNSGYAFAVNRPTNDIQAVSAGNSLRSTSRKGEWKTP